MPLRNHKILLTGGSGFIGFSTLQHLQRTHNVSLFTGDITSTDNWNHQLQEHSPDILFLIAGIRTESDRDFIVNSLSISLLFSSIQRLQKIPKKIILASSQAVYMGLNTPFLEDMEPLPPTLYGLSKYFGEKLAQDWCKRLGIPLVILRYSTVLGPGVRESSKMSGPLFAWTKAAKEGEPINIFQDGNQTRDYIHINDVVSANSLALSLPKGIYNVGGGEPIKVIDIARWVKESLSSSSPLVIKGGIPTSSDPQIMFSNISKLQGFGWLPKFSPKEAVNAFALSQI